MMRCDHTIQMTQERQLMSGILSVTTTFRLMVTGGTDAKQLDQIIRILRLQKDILEEDEIEDILPNLAWYCPPALLQTPGA
jgi:hypothetical protein